VLLSAAIPLELFEVLRR